MKWNLWRDTLAGCLGLFALLQCNGCGTGASSLGSASLAVQGDSNVHQGAQTRYTVIDAGKVRSDVHWQLNATTAAGAAGTIDASGNYTAPATIPAANTFQVTATDPATQRSASQTVTLLEPMPAVASASYTSADGGKTALLTIQGSNLNGNAVVLIDGAAMTGAAKADGSFSIPVDWSPKPQVQVAVQNPGPGAQTSASMTLSLDAAALAITGSTQVTAGSTAQYAVRAGNTQSGAIAWAVNGIAGGSAATGTVSTQGIYQAPVTLPEAGAVFLSATDTVTQKTGSLTVSLLQPVPAITAASLVSIDNGSTGTLTVKATGLGSAATVLVEGSDAGAAKKDAGTLTASLRLHGEITLRIAVKNSGPGAQTSAAQSVPVVIQGATARAAGRLLAQSTFGATPALIQQVQASGLQAFLNQQFAQPPSLLTAVPATLPAWAQNNEDYYVDANWWNNLATGNDPTRQRVAFALSEIFVVSEEKVGGAMFPLFLNTLSKDAFGNWRDLMKDVTVTPAMGYYLDMMASANPAAGQSANENYARELMQLFSLGTNQLALDGTPVLDGGGNPVPNYTPAQVQAFARAFTGWYLQNKTADAYFLPMVPTESKHATDRKELLNGTVLPAGQTAEKDLDDALDNIFQQASLPPFIGKQLIQHLVTSNPSPAYVRRVATVFVDNGSGVRGDMAAVVRAVLMDPEAREMDDANVSRPDFGHLQEPILWISSVLLGTGYSNTAADPASAWLEVSAAAGLMRQPTHSPDSVFNYFPPQNALPKSDTLLAPEFGLENTSAVLARLDVASRIVDGTFSGIRPDLSAKGTWATLAANPQDLVDRLNTVFFSGGMSSGVQQVLLNTITPMKDNAERARTALFLVVTSPSFLIRR